MDNKQKINIVKEILSRFENFDNVYPTQNYMQALKEIKKVVEG